MVEARGGGSSLRARGYRSRTFKLRGEAEGHGWGCGRGARGREGGVGGGRGVTIGSVGFGFCSRNSCFL